LAKLQAHYGTLYTDKSKFTEEVLIKEQNFSKPGERMEHADLNKKGFEVQQVCLSDETFTQMNFFAQALLPFFIEGASAIEPSPFWRYFLVYNQQ
jgi:hypothetical protein